MPKVNFAKTEHIELISEFEKEYFRNEAYSFDSLSKMMEDNYILKDNDNIFTIYSDYDLLGYAIFHIQNEFTDIYKIFIRENNRHCGFAKMLLDKISEIAKRYNSKKLMLEVRESNTDAINFYSHYGFKNVSIRKDYYKNPLENALIYEKEIN